VKLREYLAHGLPVVSVDVPEVRLFSSAVRIASGPEAFVAALEHAIEEGRRIPEPDAMPWSWDDCADEMMRLIEQALAGL
jgi:hypothetical protein